MLQINARNKSQRLIGHVRLSSAVASLHDRASAKKFFAAEKQPSPSNKRYEITRNRRCPSTMVVQPRVVTRSKLLPLTKRFYVRRSGPTRRNLISHSSCRGNFVI